MGNRAVPAALQSQNGSQQGKGRGLKGRSMLLNHNHVLRTLGQGRMLIMPAAVVPYCMHHATRFCCRSLYVKHEQHWCAAAHMSGSPSTDTVSDRPVCGR
jgi:hypothetical protein